MATRRAIITAIVAFPFAGIGIATADAGQDPIIGMIEAYREGVADYSAAPQTEDEEQKAYQSWGRPLADICERTPSIYTMAGALAAMHFLCEEATNYIGSEAILPLARAVVGFLEKSGSA